MTRTSEERRQYVTGEVSHLLGTDWPDNIARRLGYSDAASLNASLAKWGRRDLAARFEKSAYDGLVPTRNAQAASTRKSNQRQEQPA